MPKARPVTHPYGTRVLRIGLEDGLDIWELQIKLIGWGSGTLNEGIGVKMDPVRVHGTFDTTTRDAVKRFQKVLGLPITGVVDGATYRAIDREAAEYPVFVLDLRCPCVTGKNNGPIKVCRCEKHDEDGKGQECDGFGKGRFKNQYLLTGKKLADKKTPLDHAGEVYHMYESPGMDKALLWAVRAIMRRASLGKHAIRISAGYRCWWDNYNHTDDIRWHHRRSTLHFGKSIELFHADGLRCVHDKPNSACAECQRIQDVATDKCGFQLRWHDADRLSVLEVAEKGPPPRTLHAVHIDTVQRDNRVDDDWVKTELDALKPQFDSKLASVSYPLDLGEGLDPFVADSVKFFDKNETGPGGWFPLGRSRLWHGGIHLYPEAGKPYVHAIADGVVVGCRVGEAENVKEYGSRNFVLLKHKWTAEGAFKDKEFYTLYMHLDKGAAVADSEIAWRKELYLRTKRHVEALLPLPILKQVKVDNVNRLRPWVRPTDDDRRGLAPGDCRQIPDGENEDLANKLDTSIPNKADFQVVKLTDPVDSYLYVKLDNNVVAKIHEAVVGLQTLIDDKKPIGLKDGAPIRVYAGDKLGKVAAEATDAKLNTHGKLVHIEAFSTDKLLDAGYIHVDASGWNEKKLGERKEVVKLLNDKGVLTQQTKDVLFESEKEMKDGVIKGDKLKLRKTVVQMPSAWAVDWRNVLTADSLPFPQEADRTAMGPKINDYNWWNDVHGVVAAIPEKPFHYHPISFLLELANGTP